MASNNDIGLLWHVSSHVLYDHVYLFAKEHPESADPVSVRKKCLISRLDYVDSISSKAVEDNKGRYRHDTHA